MKRAFAVKEKTFFLVSQVLSFRHTKQTSKNVVDTIFKAFKKIKTLSVNFIERD